MIKTILFHYTKRQQGVDKKKLQEFFLSWTSELYLKIQVIFQLSLGESFTSQMFQVETVMFLLSCDIYNTQLHTLPPMPLVPTAFLIHLVQVHFSVNL